MKHINRMYGQGAEVLNVRTDGTTDLKVTEIRFLLVLLKI
jgi:hypothetical protein